MIAWCREKAEEMEMIMTVQIIGTRQRRGKGLVACDPGDWARFLSI
jgi:hypothetical protein